MISTEKPTLLLLKISLSSESLIFPLWIRLVISSLTAHITWHRYLNSKTGWLYKTTVPFPDPHRYIDFDLATLSLIPAGSIILQSFSRFAFNNSTFLPTIHKSSAYSLCSKLILQLWDMSLMRPVSPKRSINSLKFALNNN